MVVISKPATCSERRPVPTGREAGFRCAVDGNTVAGRVALRRGNQCLRRKR